MINEKRANNPMTKENERRESLTRRYASNNRMKMGAGRGPGRGARVPGQKLNKTVLKRLLALIFTPNKGKLTLVIACVIVSSLVTAVSAAFMETLIDDYILPLMITENPVLTGMARAILTMACVYALGIIASYTSNIIMVGIAQKTLMQVRDRMFAHMQHLPVRYFDTHTHGEVMSHFTNDTDTLRQMIAQSIPSVVSSLITVAVVFVFMLFNSVYLTLFTLLTVAAMLFITGKVGGQAGRFFVGQQRSLGAVNGYIEEMINGQKVVKVFNHESAAKEDFDILNDDLCENAYQANRFANILQPIMGNLGNLQYVLLAVVGGALAIGNIGGLTLGGVVAFLSLSRSFSNPVTQMFQQFNSIVMALAGADRIFKLMDEKPETDDGYVTLVNAKEENGTIVECAERTGVWAWKHPHKADGTVTYTKLMGNVTMNMVDFAYDPEKPVLKDITLYAEPGQKVAFVGATGAGKTTITNLINRFYDIADGKIRYDGININKIKKDDLRRSLGIVLQDTNLFTGTVMENIRYGRLDAKDEDVIVAARLANADDFIRRLPQGYDTMLTGNGANLSQGQRQLIAIARAAVADPPVMILDEATSSIDTRTEAIVQRGMDSLMKGRTVFVIAHRLSTVRNSDVIMVLDHGEIIERGSHEKLIAEHGQYYQLYTGVFELE